MSTITVTDPVTGLRTVVESNDAEQTHGVNAAGEPLGLVPLGTAFAVVPEKPAGNGWTWDFTLHGWKHTMTLSDAIAEALVTVDASAGAARLRYITDVPGQQATYVVKEQEASEFMTNGGTPGPYLQAEAVAMGATPTQAAQLILGIAAQWNGVFGPAIEGARRAAKISIGAATTLQQVSTRRTAAINTIGAL